MRRCWIHSCRCIMDLRRLGLLISKILDVCWLKWLFCGFALWYWLWIGHIQDNFLCPWSHLCKLDYSLPKWWATNASGLQAVSLWIAHFWFGNPSTVMQFFTGSECVFWCLFEKPCLWMSWAHAWIWSRSMLIVGQVLLYGLNMKGESIAVHVNGEFNSLLFGGWIG